MSEAREVVLGRIRAGLAGVLPDPEPAAATFRRRSDDDREALVRAFMARAAEYKVRVERTPATQAGVAVARLLAERGHRRMAVPRDLPRDLIPDGIDAIPDAALDNATIAACDGVLTTCACAIAQTGTLVLDHGTGQGRRVLTLLPDYHLCVVPADAIVGLVPEAVERIAAAVHAGRPLTFISGPSATSDIELSRVEGVHGPRTLDILVVEG